MGTTTNKAQEATAVFEVAGALLAGINHVATVTADLGRLEIFYERTFGAAVVRRWDGDQRHSMIRLGPTTVLHAFERTDSPHIGSVRDLFHRGRLDHIGLNVESREAFDCLRERLLQLGVSDGSVTEFPMISSVRFVDPDGMEVELCWQESDSGSVVRRFYEGWNNGSIDFSSLVAESIVNHQPETEPEQGRQRFEEAIRAVMRAVPDSHWTVTDLLTDGDRVTVRTTWSGTYQAHSFRGFTVPVPASFSVEHVHIYRISEGKLIEHWVVRDDLTMLRQLGAIPIQSSDSAPPRGESGDLSVRFNADRASGPSAPAFEP